MAPSDLPSYFLSKHFYNSQRDISTQITLLTLRFHNTQESFRFARNRWTLDDKSCELMSPFIWCVVCLRPTHLRALALPFALATNDTVPSLK